MEDGKSPPVKQYNLHLPYADVSLVFLSTHSSGLVVSTCQRALLKIYIWEDDDLLGNNMFLTYINY